MFEVLAYSRAPALALLHSCVVMCSCGCMLGGVACLRTCVLGVLACVSAWVLCRLVFLHAWVLGVLMYLHACVLTHLCANVLAFFACWCHYVFAYLGLRANMSFMLAILKCFTCLRASVPGVLICFTCFANQKLKSKILILKNLFVLLRTTFLLCDFCRV